jgi:hypothetical protein
MTSEVVQGRKALEFDSDRDVIGHAITKLDGLHLEVWDGPRVVIRLKSTHEGPGHYCGLILTPQDGGSVLGTHFSILRLPAGQNLDREA